MLDTFIIDRIRRERERERGSRQVPLRIETPRPPPPRPTADDSVTKEKRGSVEIDFTI